MSLMEPHARGVLTAPREGSAGEGVLPALPGSAPPSKALPAPPARGCPPLTHSPPSPQPCRESPGGAHRAPWGIPPISPSPHLPPQDMAQNWSLSSHRGNETTVMLPLGTLPQKPRSPCHQRQHPLPHQTEQPPAPQLHPCLDQALMLCAFCLPPTKPSATLQHFG